METELLRALMAAEACGSTREEENGVGRKKMYEPSDLIRRCGEKKREGGAWARDDRRISIRRLRAEEGIGRVERAVRRGGRWAGENAAH